METRAYRVQPGVEAETPSAGGSEWLQLQCLVGFPASHLWSPPSHRLHLHTSPGPPSHPCSSSLFSPHIHPLALLLKGPDHHTSIQAGVWTHRVSRVLRVLQPSPGRPHVALALTPVLPSPVGLSSQPSPRDSPCYKVLPWKRLRFAPSDFPMVQALPSRPQRSSSTPSSKTDLWSFALLGSGCSHPTSQPAGSASVSGLSPELCTTAPGPSLLQPHGKMKPTAPL